jgi:hypothetical protein
MAYQYNDGLEYDDSDHDWVDVPILNLDNVSSSEAGAPANDHNAAAQGIDLSMSMNMNNLQLAEHAPPSYPSSNDGSVRCPDGPERKSPANKWLPVAPATGLGEMQHRRRASFDEVEDQLFYSVSIWGEKIQPAPRRSFDPSWEDMRAGFLRQDPHLVAPTDSVRATKGKSSGSASVSQSSVYSSMSSGWKSSSIDPVHKAGSWIVESTLGSWDMEIEEEAVEEEGD